MWKAAIEYDSVVEENNFNSLRTPLPYIVNDNLYENTDARKRVGNLRFNFVNRLTIDGQVIHVGDTIKVNECSLTSNGAIAKNIVYGIATSSGVMTPATGIDGVVDFYSTQESNESDKRKHIYPLIVRNGNDDNNAANAVLGVWRTLPDAEWKHNERVMHDIMENENAGDYHVIIIRRASIDDDYRWEILDSVGNVISTSNVS